MTLQTTTQAGANPPRFTFRPATTRSHQAISGVVIALEEAYAALRSRWPELPAVVITVFYDRHRSVRGYFWDGQWRSQADPFLPELHIDSTILSDPPEAILKTLVHEAAHALARARDIKDTSREGRYHNQRFAELAEEMGLIVEPDARIGIRTPSLRTEWLAGHYGPLVETIAAASQRLWQEDHSTLVRVGGNGQVGRVTPNGPTKSKGRLVKAVCGCSPPRIIRAARNTLQAAPIRCAACGGAFTLDIHTKEISP
ncbi:MAG: hypothetical protein IT317_10705 [Anaerolineales bacterium]|nr:hypothetical protein [Anaerolineales bacterium]